MTRRLASHGLAVLTVGAVTALCLAVDPAATVGMGALVLAILVTAWRGSFGPTLLAAVLATLAAAWCFVPPRGALLPATAEGALSLLLVLAVGLATAGLASSLRRRSHELAEERERFRVTLASIGDGVVVTDTESRVTFLNEVAEALIGWRLAEAAGRPLAEVFPIRNERTGRPVPNPVERVLAEGSIVGLANHTVLTARDGSERAIDDSAAPIRQRDGSIAGVVLVFRDIGEKRQLAAARQRLAAVVESSEDAIIAQTLDATVSAWNRGAERLFGFTAEEVVGRPMAESVVPPDRVDELLRALARVGRGERVEHFVTVRRRKDGRPVPVSIRLSPIRDEEGAIVGASAIDRDISAQVMAERRRNVRLAVTQILADSADLAAAAPRILTAVCRELEWDVGSFWRLDDDGEALRCAWFWQAPGRDHSRFAAATRDRPLPRGESLPGRVWERAEPQWVPDVTADPGFVRAAEARDEGLHGAFACPVAVGGDVHGVLEFFSHEIQPPDADLLELAGTIGGQLGQFIERRRAEAEVRRRERELSDFFDNATMGLHWVGPDGTILRANRCELELLGYDEEEYVGRHIADFHADQETIDDILQRLHAGEPLVDRPARMICKDGSIRHVLINSSVLWEDDRFVHTRCFTRDVTEQKQMEDALREADRRKDEFLAMLSHELRNPLAPIRHGLEILALRHGEDKIIRSMQSQIVHLVRLVDDLLDVSRIMRGRVELRPETVELGELVRQSAAAVRPQVTRREQELVLTLPDEPIPLHADRVRVVQVIENLLNNASKYTEPGGRIEVSAEAEDGEVRLTVRDEGIGIEPELLPHVFDLFTQSPRTLERAQGGLGIGLTLARQLVSLHGGSVTAESPGSGQGATFTVRLPTGGPAAAAAAEGADAANTRPRRILVVDDNREAAEMLSMLLQTLGEHRVTVAHDGESALRRAREERPEILLLDIGLPGLDGYEVGRRLRQDPNTNGALVVAVTGYGQEEDRRRSRAAGFDEHLVKPVAVAELQRVLAHPKLDTLEA